MKPTHMQARALVRLDNALQSLSIAMHHSRDVDEWKRELANVQSRLECLHHYVYKETADEEEGRL